MGDPSSSDDSWESVPWLTDAAWFCCLNRNLISDWPKVYIISFYFIMSNMYDVYLSKIDEYALVKKDVFGTFFGSKLEKAFVNPSGEAEQGNDDEEEEEEERNRNSSSQISRALSCILEDENQLLSPQQKHCVRSAIAKEANAKVPGALRFHIYVGSMEGGVHMVHCKCCAYELAKVLIAILENYERYQRKPESMIKAAKHMPDIIARLNQHVDVNANSYMDLIPRKTSLMNNWGSHVHFLNGAIELRPPRQSYRRIAFTSAVILLYSLMPHAFAFSHLCKLIRRSDHQTLIEVSSIIDRLLLNFPKEMDVWSMKLFLMKTLFRHIPQNDSCMIDNIITLLDRRCMDVETFCLTVTKKGQMNGRIPWFLWNLYVHIRDRTTKRTRKASLIRTRLKLESYFLRIYKSLLVANRGYQGIFYLYLHIVRGDPDGIRALREICEQAETNSSWQANLGILSTLS